MAELTYSSAAAVMYEKAFANVSSYFVPFLLRAAAVASGQRILDIATGTGLAAAEALKIVGTTGHVTAADVSAAMVEQARKRLAGAANASTGVEDGQTLSFADASFDAVTCSLGLMFYPDPTRGLAEMRRVLRPGGRAAVSVLTTPERSYNGRINVVAARHLPSLAGATARTFSLGGGTKLLGMFTDTGFSDVATSLVRHNFVLPSFNDYYEPFDLGGGSTGEALAKLPQAARDEVREEVRRSLDDMGGPVTVVVEFRIASGRK